MRGTLPDMFSDSDRYIKLLNIYRNKAAQDADQVYRRVQTHLESIGKSPVSKLNFPRIITLVAIVFTHNFLFSRIQ